MALSNSFRSAAKLLPSSESLLSNSASAKVFHSIGIKRMVGRHGQDEMKHQKLKMSLAVFTAFSIGVAVPVYAVIFQQKKTASA